MANTFTVATIRTSLNRDEDELQLSPPQEGEVFASGLIENKHLADDPEKCLPQVQADMIVAAGETLYRRLKDDHFSKEGILNCNFLTVYGMLCAQTGLFGALKLSVGFTTNRMVFSSKVLFNNYNRFHSIFAIRFLSKVHS